MNNKPQFSWWFLCPKYWGIWLGFAILKPFSYLPYSWNLTLGEKLGNLFYQLAKSRRKLAFKNINLAFPNHSVEQNNAILKEHFQSLGISLFEENMINRFKDFSAQKISFIDKIEIRGAENLQHDSKQGLIIIIPHFTTIHVTGFALSLKTPYEGIYRAHNNPLMDYLIKKNRTINSSDGRRVEPIANSQTRQMIKSLKKGNNILILPDQRYRSKGSIKVPFFGLKAPSNPGVNKLAKLGKAKVVTCFTKRIDGQYILTISPPLDNFPSGDDYQDTLVLHQLYEQEINQVPAQYLWVHDRWDIKKSITH